MGSLKVVVSFNAVTGMAEDIVQNTFAVETPNAAAGAQLADIADAFEDFYKEPAAFGRPSISEYFGPMLDRAANAANVALYDIDGKLAGQPHGSPIYENTFTIDAAGNASPIPEEVALCVTLRGLGWQTALAEVPDGPDAGTAKDRPKQRRSGRTYLGPLNGSAGNSTNGRSHPHGDFRTDVHDAFDKLADELVSSASSYLAVWSKQDSALYRVTHIQTDDAWDTQRRRGRAATVRGTREVYVP